MDQTFAEYERRKAQQSIAYTELLYLYLDYDMFLLLTLLGIKYFSQRRSQHWLSRVTIELIRT